MGPDNAEQNATYSLLTVALIRGVVHGTDPRMVDPDVDDGICIAAVGALEAYAEVLPDMLPTDAIRVFVGGGGGTGKSATIRAVVAFARSWGMEESCSRPPRTTAQ